MLRDLRLHHFRCFDDLVFEPSPGSKPYRRRTRKGRRLSSKRCVSCSALQSPRSASLAEAVRVDHPGFGLDGHWNEQHMHVKFAMRCKAFALDSQTAIAIR